MLRTGFQLGVLFLFSIGLISCSTTKESQTPPPSSALCSRYGNDEHFNSTRIKALQDLVSQQIQVAKSAPLSQKNSTLLPALEVLRRRVHYPFLQPSLTPHVVTQIIQREAGYLISTLEREAPSTPNTTSTVQFLNQSYLPSLENREEWSCTSAAATQPGSPSGEATESAAPQPVAPQPVAPPAESSAEPQKTP